VWRNRQTARLFIRRWEGGREREVEREFGWKEEEEEREKSEGRDGRLEKERERESMKVLEKKMPVGPIHTYIGSEPLSLLSLREF
jgi:hypothetical protein